MIWLYPKTWEQLLEDERGMRTSLSEVSPAEDLRAWFAAASHIMAVCTSESRSGYLTIRAPSEVFAVMFGMTDSLARGIMPGPITNATKSRGRKRVSRLEEKDIGWASIYIRACKSKPPILSDKTPIKTISAKYMVERQTAQAWGNMSPPLSLPPMNDIHPSFIIDEMESAAVRYANAGRSGAAVKHRGRHSK